MADHPPAFTVIVAPEVLRQIQLWASHFTDPGRRAAYLDALKVMDRSLNDNPVGWGDSLWNYQHIAARECRGMVPRWLLVWYGVDSVARVVVVRDIRPAPGSPLPPPA